MQFFTTIFLLAAAAMHVVAMPMPGSESSLAARTSADVDSMSDAELEAFFSNMSDEELNEWESAQVFT